MSLSNLIIILEVLDVSYFINKKTIVTKPGNFEKPVLLSRLDVRHYRDITILVAVMS